MNKGKINAFLNRHMKSGLTRHKSDHSEITAIRGSRDMSNFKLVPQPILEKCLKSLGESEQEKSVLAYILSNPFNLTHEIAAGAGAINVPQVVKDLRPKCIKFGIEIFNYLPACRHINRHGRPSQLHRWYGEFNPVIYKQRQKVLTENCAEM
ncbi:hypothetical protein ACVBEJ_01730 [Porticoccus sp. GXU_MW_L64]